MAIASSDISIVLSGGSSNTNPNNSIGGDPSSTGVINGVLNNLFDNVSPENALSGETDYRCIYIFNNHETDTFYNVKLWIHSQIEQGSEIQIGIRPANELQKITFERIYDNATSFKLSLDGIDTNDIVWDDTWNADIGGNPINLASTIQSSLNSVLDSVSVSSSDDGTNYIIFVNFTDSLANQNVPLLSILDNTLTVSGIPATDPTVIAQQSGGPINDIAQDIGNEHTSPTNVVFQDYLSESPLAIGNLANENGFPLWIKRFTTNGSGFLENDNFVLRIKGSPINIE